MFSFVSVVLLVAIIARTQALECYQGTASDHHSVTSRLCPLSAKYCHSITSNWAPSRYGEYGCGFGLCKEKGCRTIAYNTRTICCCASDRCNKG
ncbi:unnamed protein product [Cylicocyclus nassatus]|uniref:Uncharacterized protein n=1 Tax=Cylicocyclus nassatus TaxID=53992 RepID=A0AA36GTP0_CYLNA|nr:unnamed protein product [Cylicocyclus nassatus]